MIKTTIFGHFAFGKNASNGQTIKTQNITNELERILGSDNIKKIDTHNGKKKLLQFPFMIRRALRESQNVIILPAHNGLRIIAPLLATENRVYHRKLHYIVIGGWLPEYLKKHRHLVKYLKRFNGIYVETTTMKKALEAQGFTNVIVMPNFKDIKVLQPEELGYQTEKPFSLCTFSRVVREKGIEDAINAVKAINSEMGEKVFILDIYGQVDQTYSERFEALQTEFPDYIRYKGVVPANESVDVIKNYYALLFPTYYYTEGIPGTIIDAYASGVPVIAALWQNHLDVFTDGVTGYGYDFGSYNCFKNRLYEILQNPEQWNALKQNCLQEAEKYRPENVMQILLSELE